MLRIVCTWVVLSLTRDARADDAWCERRLLAPFRAYTGVQSGDAWNEAPVGGAPDAGTEGGDAVAIVPGGGIADAGSGGRPSDGMRAWTQVGDGLRRRGSVAVVIATVPDPIDTGYVNAFDEIWGAVELGVEQFDYLRDEMWLPWADTHLADKANQTVDEDCRERVPGALLLRHEDGAEGGSPPATLVVFYVGETPTEGVHKAALARALELASKLEPNGTIRIVGPTFSGSAASLRSVLDRVVDAPDGGRSVHIVSGTASNATIDTRLAWGADAGKVAGTFHRTALEDKVVDEVFFPWLRRRTWNSVRIGLLEEEGTLFGKDEPADAGADAASGPSVILHFRRGIADLQRAHQLQDARDQKKSPADPSLASLTALLDPSFDERLTPRTTALDPSPKRLAALDLELRDLLGAVSREGLAYLAIRATDSGDAVFLAQQVNALAPDVRIVFMTADVLLLHPAFEGKFRGSLVVTPYPFLGMSDFVGPRSGPGDQHHPWESDGAEGAYNATIAALAEYESAAGSSAQLAEVALFSSLDGGVVTCPSADSLLPLWVGAIGNGTIYPLDVLPIRRACRDALFDPYAATAECTPRSAGGSAGGSAGCLVPVEGLGENTTLVLSPGVTPPRAWGILFTLLVFVGIGEHVLFERSPRGKPAKASPGHLLLTAKYLRYAALRSVVLAAVCAYMGVTSIVAIASEPGAGSGDKVWPSVACLCALALAALATCRLARAARFDVSVHGDLPPHEAPAANAAFLSRADARRLHTIHAYAVYVPLVSLLLYAIVQAGRDLPLYLTHWWRLPLTATPAGVAFVERSLSLESGLSAPLIVVVMGLALAVWTTCVLHRVDLTQSLVETVPFGACPARLLAAPIAFVLGDDALVAIEERVQEVLQIPAARQVSRAASSALVIGLVGVFAVRFETVSSLEQNDTGALFVLLGTVAFVVALSGQHLVEFGVTFRRLLDRLHSWEKSSVFILATPYVGSPVSRLVTGRYCKLEELLVCKAIAPPCVDVSNDKLARKLLLCARALRASDGWARDFGVLVSTHPAAGAEDRGKAGPSTNDDVRFVATVLGVLLNRYIRHFRDFMTATTMTAVFVVIAIAWYPFEPHRLMMTAAWILTMSSVGIGAYVLLGIERSPVVGALSGSSATGFKLSRDMVLRFFMWVVVPLVSVFAAEYPALGHLVATVFEPISGALK